MAIAIIECVVTMLALVSQSELAKELDHEAAQELKSIHARLHAMRQSLHSKVHHVFHKHPPKEPVK